LCLSPAYGPYLIWRGFGSGFHPGEKTEFWQNLVVTLGWSILALGAAAFALKRVWREREEEGGIDGWHKYWRQWVHGDRESRQRLGRSWMDENPFVWLAGRKRQAATLGWLIVGGIVLAWLLCWAVWPLQWCSVLNLFMTATLLNLVFIWLTLHTAAQELGLARRDGAYELLLTTPLDPGEIVWGELEALRWQFRPLSNFMLMMNALMLLGGLLTRSWNTGALVVYFCIWLLLVFWTWRLGHRWSRALPVMWASLNCGRPAHAVWRASGFNSGSGFNWWYWIWICNLHNVRFFGGTRQGFPTGSSLEVVAALLITCVFFIICLVKHFRTDRDWVSDLKWDAQKKVWLPKLSSIGSKGAKQERICGRRLIREFREIVREPLPDPTDPRFKKWNPQERFPWGWGLVQQQLHERVVRKSEELNPLDRQ
jgi:hypothetical protein